MKILAIDVGKKRIGLATCDRLEIAATPFAVVKAGKNAIDEILKIVEKEQVEAIVIGMPVSFDGKERESCQMARFFKNELASKTSIEIEFYDERLTSKIAENSLLEGGFSRDERKGKIDAVAASIILQGYLDNRRNRGITP
ncbi:MAG: Holliday junction resolvase RuvX [Candidatus Rifleibacteriota bacterium]